MIRSARSLFRRSRLVPAVVNATIAGTLAFSALTPVAAQMPAPSDTTAPSPLFTRRDAILAAGFAVGTVAMFPIDRRLAVHLSNPGAQANSFFKNSSRGLESFTSPGAYYIGGGLYLIGRIGKFDRIADLGWHGSEAIIASDLVTYVLKGVTGRARPFVSSDTNPHDFKLLKGFGNNDRQSFPSGHAETAFAAAAAVTAETGRWWPKSTWIVGPVMYTGATLVGLSRMYHSKHWASDVVLGAAIGTFAGQKVVQYSHSHHTFTDRILLHTALLPDSHGVLVAWSAPLP